MLMALRKRQSRRCPARRWLSSDSVPEHRHYFYTSLFVCMEKKKKKNLHINRIEGGKSNSHSL